MMNPQEEKYIKMTTQPVQKLICTLAVPTVISMLVTSFYNMADTFFVSKINPSATGAVGVVFSLMAIIQACGFFFGHGSGNFISRSLGGKNFDKAEKMASTGFFSAFIAGVIIMITGFIFIKPLAVLLGATDTILPYAVSYMKYILIGAPYMTASFVLNNQLRFQGNAFYAMIGIGCGAVLNLALDPLLIFGFKLGISGAAIATAASQLISFIILLIGVSKSDALKIKFSNFTPKLIYYKEIFNGGTASLCRQGIAAVATICLNHAAGVYGDEAIAAISVVSKIMMFASSALIGFGQGFQPVCGFNYGAKKYDRVRKAFFFSVKFSFVFLLFVSAAAFIFAPDIIEMFSDKNETITEIGTAAFRLQLITFPLMSWVVLSNMMLQNIGCVFKSSFLAAARQGIVLIPLLFILPELFGLNGIIIAQPLADFISLIIAVPLEVTTLNSLKRAQSEG